MRILKSLVLLIAIVIGSAIFALAAGPTTGQARCLLPDGRVLVTGGFDASGKPSASASLTTADGVAIVQLEGMNHARAGHTTTVLPDGKILIFGGFATGNSLVRQMELFDPQRQSFEDIDSPLVPRALHSATLLSDGLLLVVGGYVQGGLYTTELQTWDFRTGKIATLPTRMHFSRVGHSAELASDGTVLVHGGLNSSGKTIADDEVFDETSGSLQVRKVTVISTPGLSLSQAIPQDGADSVSPSQLLSMRFSRLVRMDDINSSNIDLRDPSGDHVDSNIVAAEAGRLAFITPVEPLESGLEYTIRIHGLSDLSGNQISETFIHFRTDLLASDSSDEMWIPDADALRGNWQSRTGHSKWEDLPALQAGRGVTALSGRVLRLNGLPLSHVTLSIDGQSAQTDSTGRFLVQNLHSGRLVLVIDGQSANHGTVQYGLYEVAVELGAAKTNVLNYTIWMSRLDVQHAVNIPSPTTALDTVITSPFLPGLEVHLPQNTVIRDRDGKPIHEISITPIPIDKPPFPLPVGVRVPIYFTIQPGGAYVDVRSNAAGAKGARIVYPNTYGEHPGTAFDFWNYDADSRGWYVYGQGRVAPDGKSVVPNPGVVVYEFTGAMVGVPTIAPSTFPTPGGNSSDGDPVDLSTGLFVYTKTDLAIADTIPIELVRTYRTNDNSSRPFGVGTTHNYNIFLIGDTNPWTYQELVLPNGTRIHFDRTSSGTGWSDAVYVHNSARDSFYGAVISWNTDPSLPGAWKLQLKDGTILSFPDGYQTTDPNHSALLQIKDRYGRAVKVTRDSNSRVTQVSSPNGRYINFQYDAQSRIVSATDNIGRTVGYTYDANGNLASVQDVNQGTTSFTYDSAHEMLTITDPRNITYLTNQYDAVGRVIKQTQADGSTYQFAWAVANAAQTWSKTIGGVVGGSGPINRYSSTDSAGYAALVSSVDVTNPRGYIRHVQFNSQGLKSGETLAAGQPEQQTASYQYYSDNLPKSVTDSLGRVTSFDYDTSGHTSRITRLDGTSDAVTSTFTYTANFGLLATTTDALNHTTTFQYDSIGNLVTVTDPLGHIVRTTYNAVGQPVAITDPLNNKVQLSYFNGDLASITDPLGNTSTRWFDNAGRLLALRDARGNTTSYQYNKANQVTQTTDAAGATTLFTYDPNGNVLTVTDALNHSTTYTYDNMDRRATRTDPLQREESYSFDLGGNLASFANRKGQVTSYEYDGLNRVSSAAFGVQQGQQGNTSESTISYSYDAGSRMTLAVDSSSGTVARAYNLLDLLTSETTPQGAINYTYDAVGRRSTMQVAGQPQVSYSWDNANRLTGITQDASSVAFSYDAADRRFTLTLPNGVVATYSYDDASRLTGISYSVGSNSIGNLTYTYDEVGRRTSVGGTLARTGLPAAVDNATYDAANQLTNWNGTSIAYDANGSMIGDGVNTYSWNARNELSAITGGTQAAFGYDFAGRRTANSTGRLFQYDRQDAVQEFVAGSPVASRINGGVDEFFARTTSGGALYPLTDVLGSVIALTDSSGQLQTQYTYDPYGGSSTSGYVSDSYAQFTGRENEGNGLYYYRARYYNPAFGRFISQDPLGFSGGSANLYAYAKNSPTDFRDPSGKNPACVVGGLLGTIGYNSYVIYQSMAGRKASYYAGWSGLGHILSGNAMAFGAGCAAGSFLGSMSFAVPESTGAVYGGGAGGAQAAAEASGLNLIQDTIGGQVAENLTAGAPRWLSNWVWDYASAQYAGGLEGTVTVFEGSFGELGEFAAQSDLITVEMPILQNAAQSGVVNLVYAVVP